MPVTKWGLSSEGATFGAWLLGTLVLVGGIFLRVSFWDPKGRTPDEQIYTAYAREVSLRGPAAVQKLVGRFNSVPTMRKFPRPTRVGFYMPAGFLMRITNEKTSRTLSAFSTVASLVALLSCAILGLKTLGPFGALGALLLLAASPLDLAMARRAWTDALCGALTGGMILAYAHILEHPGRKGAYLLFFVLGLWGLLVKETMTIILGLGCFGLAMHAWYTTKRLSSVIWPLAGGALMGGVAIAVLLWLSGGVHNLLNVFRPLPGAAPSEYLLLVRQRRPWLLCCWHAPSSTNPLSPWDTWGSSCGDASAHRV